MLAKGPKQSTVGSLGAGVPGCATDGPGLILVTQTKWARLLHSVIPHSHAFISPYDSLKQMLQVEDGGTPWVVSFSVLGFCVVP